MGEAAVGDVAREGHRFPRVRLPLYTHGTRTEGRQVVGVLDTVALIAGLAAYPKDVQVGLQRHRDGAASARQRRWRQMRKVRRSGRQWPLRIEGNVGSGGRGNGLPRALPNTRLLRDFGSCLQGQRRQEEQRRAQAQAENES